MCRVVCNPGDSGFRLVSVGSGGMAAEHQTRHVDRASGAPGVPCFQDSCVAGAAAISHSRCPRARPRRITHTLLSIGRFVSSRRPPARRHHFCRSGEGVLLSATVCSSAGTMRATDKTKHDCALRYGGSGLRRVSLSGNTRCPAARRVGGPLLSSGGSSLGQQVQPTGLRARFRKHRMPMSPLQSSIRLGYQLSLRPFSLTSILAHGTR